MRSACPQEAVDHLERLATTAEQPWLRQKAYLSAADAMLVLGREGSAQRLARTGLAEAGYKLTTSSLAGSYARWISILAHCDGGSAEAESLLTEMATWRLELDTVDRLELILALFRLGIATAELRNEAKALMEALPNAVVNQMSALRPAVERGQSLWPQ